MSDLTDRLWRTNCDESCPPTRTEAADEIQKLRSIVRRMVREIKEYHGNFDARLFVEAERALAEKGESK